MISRISSAGVTNIIYYLLRKCRDGKIQQEVLQAKSEMETRDASKAGGGHDIFARVVDKQGFLGQGIDFAQRVVIDQRRGLAQADAAGIHAHGKVTDKRECNFDVCHVNRIGIGQQSQTALCGEAFE